MTRARLVHNPRRHSASRWHAAPALLLLFAAGPARGAVTPEPEPGHDPRIVRATYVPHQIVRVFVAGDGHGGTQVEFAPDETKFTVALMAKGWTWTQGGCSDKADAATECADPENQLYFSTQAGAKARPVVVSIVATGAGNARRPYHLELIPVSPADPDAVPDDPDGPGGARMAARPIRDLRHLPPSGPLDAAGTDAVPEPGQEAAGASPAPVAFVSVRFVYPAASGRTRNGARPEAVQTATPARTPEEWAAIRTARDARRQARADEASQARLRQTVADAAEATRWRCNSKWRGAGALVPEKVCSDGHFTKFYYGSAPVPALFAVSPSGDNVKVPPPEALPREPGVVLVRTTSEFWRAHAGPTQVAEFYDAGFNERGGPSTGTDTASPGVRLTVVPPAPHPAGRR